MSAAPEKAGQPTTHTQLGTSAHPNLLLTTTRPKAAATRIPLFHLSGKFDLHQVRSFVLTTLHVLLRPRLGLSFTHRLPNHRLFAYKNTPSQRL